MNHPDFQATIQEQAPERIIVLHHWDTDGLMCAGLFMDYIERESPNTEVILYYPTINNYFLTDDEYAEIESLNADLLLTTDMNFPVDVVERLETIVPLVFVFDNHSQSIDINRPGVQELNYPGCTMLVSEYLMMPLNLRSVIGAIGDQEDRITEWTEHMPQIEQVLEDEELTLEEAIRITKKADTSYIIGTQEDIGYSIQVLRADPKRALTDERFKKNEEQIAQAFDTAVQQPLQELAPEIQHLSIDSSLSLISEVTRALSRQHPADCILTDQVWDTGYASMYARRRDMDIDLGIIVEEARKRGYNAGGKPEVAGVVLPATEVESFRSVMVELIQKHRN